MKEGAKGSFPHRRKVPKKTDDPITGEKGRMKYNRRSGGMMSIITTSRLSRIVARGTRRMIRVEIVYESVGERNDGTF